MVTPCHSPLETELDLGIQLSDIRVSELDRIPTDASSEIITIRKRRDIWSAKTKAVAKYPTKDKHPENTTYFRHRTIGGFGGELDGAYIVGNYQCVYQYDVQKDKWFDLDKNSEEKEPRGQSAKGCKIGNCFLVYGDKAEILQFKPWLSKVYDSFPSSSSYDDLNKENIDPSVHKISSKNVKLKDTRPFWRKFVDQFAIFATPKPTSLINTRQKQPRRLLDNRWICKKPMGVDGYPVYLRNHSLINIEYDKVILSGDMGQLFMGELTWDKLNVRWKRLEGARSSTRSKYLTFKMKEYVYVVGGYRQYVHGCSHGSQFSWMYPTEVIPTVRCEKYNLKTKRWSICKHSLDSPLINASVVVSPDESFAVITGGLKERKKYLNEKKLSQLNISQLNEYQMNISIESNEIKMKPMNRIIIFEEETGFTKLDDRMLRRRSDHISIVIK